jgi:tetratricopeptide (TPR) repeat protein
MPNKFVSPAGSRKYITIGLTCILLSGIFFTACKSKTEDNDNKKDPRVLAISYLQQNRFDEAEAAFKKAIKTNPEIISNYIDLAHLYMVEKNFNDAEKQIKSGLRQQPGNSDLQLLLADLYYEKGDKQAGIKELNEILSRDPKNVYAYYSLSVFAAGDKDHKAQKSYLIKVLDLVPANIVPRLELAALLAQDGKSDSALFYLQGVKKIAPDFSAPTDSMYRRTVSFLQADQPDKALFYLARLHNLMKTSREYATDMEAIEESHWVAGSSKFISSQYNQVYDKSRKVSLQDMKFSDASESVGLVIPEALKAQHSVLATAGYDDAGNMYVYTSFLKPGASSSEYYLFVSNVGGFKEIKASAGLNHEGRESDAVFADYDNDGYQDLFIATSKGIILYKNNGDGTFARIKDDKGLNNTTDGNRLLAADFDQDGDLDLFVTCKGQNKFFRNNDDGSFTEQANMMGLSGNPSGTGNMDFGDWDTDGDLDIAALATDGSLQLFSNDRHSKFENSTAAAQLQNPAYKAEAVAFGDYNNDGMPDIFVAGGTNGNCSLLRNTGNGFMVDPVSLQLSNALKGIAVHDAAFIDFDNDGREDIFVAGESADSSVKGLQLFHNDSTRGFSNVSGLLPATLTQGQRIATADFNLDGDDDIFLSGPSGISLIRNDGGNLNHYMQVQLTGLSYGNGKNNRLGIGAQVELKAGNLYQMKTVTRALMNFGIGQRDSLDAIRIIWPNGTPQLISDPSRRERLIEEEKLKGSCPFLFTWNGKRFEFVKDMMWRSALGMPLAIHGRDTAFAFSGPSKEYLLIPGENLQPQNGKYTIKITEELWEAVFFDKAALAAVDHPDTVDVYADERFVAPPYPGKKLYEVADRHYPVAATDEKGNNLLAKISTYDFRYVANFPLGKFQGLAKEHQLILDLGEKAKADKLFLFLRGWIFPTDASINTSLAQSDKYKQQPPYLQVMNKQGKWQTVISNIGFPMGKDKMVIADLSGKFLTANDRRVRIVTNMQIYWDEIFFSSGNAKAPVQVNDLPMTDARLAYRGYSASYRKGGPFGPHWFDYYNCTQGQQWRDLTGNYTRYGNVLPLLQHADDEYVIASSGDEVTIDFDATGLPALPKGWKRDFLIYSEGWVKDGDLNTAYGQTVAPLPFHSMPSYPYSGNIAYPYARHKEYLEKYNTRKVTTDDFKNALKRQTIGEKRSAAR